VVVPLASVRPDPLGAAQPEHGDVRGLTNLMTPSAPAGGPMSRARPQGQSVLGVVVVVVVVPLASVRPDPLGAAQPEHGDVRDPTNLMTPSAGADGRSAVTLRDPTNLLTPHL
jgi:hypothetical protein